MFIKQRDYNIVNNDLGSGLFGEFVSLQNPFADELFVAKEYELEYGGKVGIAKFAFDGEKYKA